MLKRIHHVGIVVADLKQAFGFWRDTLGFSLTRRVTLPEMGVQAALLAIGASEIELLEPLHSDSGVGRFLARTGGGLHHVCFETDDLEAQMAQARARGLPLIDQAPHAGIAGRVCFLHPEAGRGVLIEYVELGEQ